MFLTMFFKTQNTGQTMHLTMLIAHPYPALHLQLDKIAPILTLEKVARRISKVGGLPSPPVHFGPLQCHAPTLARHTSTPTPIPWHTR